jgi:hypothetical protein
LTDEEQQVSFGDDNQKGNSKNDRSGNSGRATATTRTTTTADSFAPLRNDNNKTDKDQQ